MRHLGRQGVTLAALLVLGCNAVWGLDEVSPTGSGGASSSLGSSVVASTSGSSSEAGSGGGGDGAGGDGAASATSTSSGGLPYCDDEHEDWLPALEPMGGGLGEWTTTAQVAAADVNGCIATHLAAGGGDVRLSTDALRGGESACVELRAGGSVDAPRNLAVALRRSRPQGAWRIGLPLQAGEFATTLRCALPPTLTPDAADVVFDAAAGAVTLTELDLQPVSCSGSDAACVPEGTDGCRGLDPSDLSDDPYLEGALVMLGWSLDRAVLARTTDGCQGFKLLGQGSTAAYELGVSVQPESNCVKLRVETVGAGTLQAALLDNGSELAFPRSFDVSAEAPTANFDCSLPVGQLNGLIIRSVGVGAVEILSVRGVLDTCQEGPCTAAEGAGGGI